MREEDCQAELMYYSNTYSISAKLQLVRTHNSAYEQCANSQAGYAFAVYAELPLLLLFASASAFASSSSCSCLPSRSCIQRFIGCYKYIIRDKYVPSSFQSVCRSGPIALFPFLSPPFLSSPSLCLAHPSLYTFPEQQEMVSNKSVQRTVAYMLSPRCVLLLPRSASHPPLPLAMGLVLHPSPPHPPPLKMERTC